MSGRLEGRVIEKEVLEVVTNLQVRALGISEPPSALQTPYEYVCLSSQAEDKADTHFSATYMDLSVKCGVHGIARQGR